jgi:hypothetical protein
MNEESSEHETKREMLTTRLRSKWEYLSKNITWDENEELWGHQKY